MGAATPGFPRWVDFLVCCWGDTPDALEHGGVWAHDRVEVVVGLIN